MPLYHVIVEDTHIWRYAIEAPDEMTAFYEAADRSLKEPPHETYNQCLRDTKKEQAEEEEARRA